MLPLIALSFSVLLIAGYTLYGRWIERQFGADDARPTPAHLREDGVDYVPTSKPYLFAQHFSAIAAAGPIAGPILACQTFGWLPCLLWIGFGVVLIGAVHDFSALTASVRHDARSVAEIAREHLGGPAGPPRCSRAISATERASWRTEAVSAEKSCTAPISTTPRPIQSRHGSQPKVWQARIGPAIGPAAAMAEKCCANR